MQITTGFKMQKAAVAQNVSNGQLLGVTAAGIAASSSDIGQSAAAADACTC
jgi:hypothetical protein